MTRWCAALVVCLGFSASIASAQDDLGAAERAFARADFEGAVAAFDRAEASAHLTRAELEQVLSHRALAHQAAGDTGGAEEDLSAWLSIAPDASFDDTVPPALRRTLERLRPEVAPLAVDATVLPSSDGFSVQARVTGDAFGLVRTTRITYVGESGPIAVDGPSAHIAEAGTLHYWIELVGPSGLVLASAGSEASPRESMHAGADATATPIAAPHDDTPLIIGVTIGAVLLAVGIAILVGFLVAPPSDTQLGAPMRVMP